MRQMKYKIMYFLFRYKLISDKIFNRLLIEMQRFSLERA